MASTGDIENEKRRVGEELAEIVRLAEEYGLPLPEEPWRRVGDVIVHPTTGLSSPMSAERADPTVTDTPDTSAGI
jgi:hypothetical protein